MTPGSQNRLQVRCSGCQALLKIKSEALGQTIACPKCGKKMKLVKPSRPSTPALSPAPPIPPEPISDLLSLPPDHLSTPAAHNAYTQASFPTAYKPRTTSKKGSLPWLWIAIAGVAASVLLIVGIVGVAVVGLIFSGSKSPGHEFADRSMTNDSSATASRGTPATGSNSAAGPVDSNFPGLGKEKPFGDKIVWHNVVLPRRGLPPLKLNIFIPKGNHTDKSLPVVFEAPAGTPLLHGADIQFPRPETEYLPFTEAGMITVSFALDGEMRASFGPEAGLPYLKLLRNAYSEFVAADAGVDNGIMAIDYVLARMPMADPNRLMVWGHSSAATVSLLLASKDSRISKCIAMAPITDLKPRLGEILQQPAMSQYLPNFDKYLESGSPITYVQQLQCPVFIAHAKNDDNAPFEVTNAYVEALRRAGGKVEFLELDREGHYKPLLDAAIPKALEWLQK